MKYNVKTDLHTHTLMSGHAYSTLEENIRYAATIGFEAIAMTNHAPALGDAPHPLHFDGFRMIPDYVSGVRVLCGVEANILDLSGKLDIDEFERKRDLDIVIASLHRESYSEFSTGLLDHTSAYMGALENPLVDILGHTGYANCPYDYEKVARRAKELHKLIEINAHTFDDRLDSVENCRKIALTCKRIGTGISIGSDAHFSSSIGEFSKVFEMLADIDFPEELIISRNYETLKKYFSVRKEI